MVSDTRDLNLPIQRGSFPPRMQLTGAQFVRWWINNLEQLAANGQLERMLFDRIRRRKVGAPFAWRD